MTTAMVINGMKSYRLRRCLSLLLLSLPVADAGGDEPLLDYRTRVMESAHRHLKAIGYVLVDDVALHDHLPAHVESLQQFSRMLPDLFPPGSRHFDSDALDLVWQHPEAFSARLREHQQSLVALKLAVQSRDWKEARGSYYQVLRTCKGCHRKFKQE